MRFQNKLLLRQIRRHFGSQENLPPEMSAFIADIESSYKGFEEDARLLVNSLDISSAELRTAYERHKKDAENQRIILDKIKEAILALDALQANHREPEVPTQGNELVDRLINLIGRHKKALDDVLKLSKAVEQNPASIVITDPFGNIEYVNRKFCELTGYEAHEVMGQNPRILKSETTQKAYSEELWKTITSGREWSGKLRNKKKNGEYFWESALIAPIINEEKQITHYLAVKEDITERIQMDEALAKLTGLQNILMNIASKYINLKISEMEPGINESLAEIGTFVEADRANIFHYDQEAQCCRNTHEWCADGIEARHENTRNVPLSIMTDWMQAHQKGESFMVEDVNLLPQGKLKTMIDSCGIRSLLTVPMMRDDQCIGFVGFDYLTKNRITTETEKRLLYVFSQMVVNLDIRAGLENNLMIEKEKAQAANRAKSEFLANMSHEIRTPMNSILGFSEVMLNTTDDAKQKNFLTTILDSGKSLLSLINDILDLSKIEAGRMEISPEPADIGLIIQEINQLFEQKAKEKNILLHFEIDPCFPRTILIDEIRLRQIILNLVGNAVKFTHSGSVSTSARLLTDEQGIISFEISVADTGIGISDEDQRRIFESFSQQSGQDYRKYGGTGLGLAISKRLCELMNGKIRVESMPEQGSTFTVYFSNIKYANESLQPENLFLWHENDLRFRQASILIVDDVPFNRQLIHAYLEGMDIRLSEAEDGEMAVEMAKFIKPDLIFMDIRMPGMNGYDATQILKNESVTASIPIIALTASTMQSEIDKLNQLFNGYLRKPVQKKSLLNEMMRFLPFDIIEPTDNNDFIVEIPNEDEVIPEEVILSFRETFEEEIKQQQLFMMTDRLFELNQLLTTFALDHQITRLHQASNELQQSIESFDFEQIQQNLTHILSLFKR